MAGKKAKPLQSEITSFASVMGVLAYLKEQGRKIERPTLFRDVKAGKLTAIEGHFLKTDVDRYAIGLPLSTTPGELTANAEERQKEKDLLDIALKKQKLEREQHRYDIERGKYVPKESVDQMLAERLSVLKTSAKSMFDALSLPIVEAVQGEPKQAKAAAKMLNDAFEELLNEYAKEAKFEVTFVEDQDEKDEE